MGGQCPPYSWVRTSVSAATGSMEDTSRNLGKLRERLLEGLLAVPR